MKKFIMRLFCRHHYLPFQQYLETQKDGSRIVRTVWKCEKCGREATFFHK